MLNYHRYQSIWISSIQFRWKPCDRLLDDVNPPLISYILEEQKDLSSYFRTSVVPSNVVIVNESRTITHVYTMTVVLSRFLCFGLSNFPNLSTLRKRTPPARIGSPSHANLAEREPRRGGAESGEAKHVPCEFYLRSVKRSCASSRVVLLPRGDRYRLNHIRSARQRRFFSYLGSFLLRVINQSVRCHSLSRRDRVFLLIPCLPARHGHAPTNHRRG